MTYLGEAGYTELMGELMEITAALRSGIEALEGLEILGTPCGPLLSFTSTTNDIFAIGDVMDERGWHLNRVDGPPGLHMMISPLHGAHVGAFLDDLTGAVAAHGVSRDVGVSYS